MAFTSSCNTSGANRPRTSPIPSILRDVLSLRERLVEAFMSGVSFSFMVMGMFIDPLRATGDHFDLFLKEAA
jgi:hypothetical protein